MAQANRWNQGWSIRTNVRFDSANPATAATAANHGQTASRAEPAQASFILTITPNLCNHFDNLHGGSASTIIDILSTTILLAVSRPGVFSLGGVSRHLDLTYLRPAPRDVDVRVRSEVVQLGKRLALLRAVIERVDTGEVCVVAAHEKVNTDPEVAKA